MEFDPETFLEGWVIVPMIIGVLVTIAILAFWIWSIVDIVSGKFESDRQLLWLVIVLFLGILGTIIYIAIGRKERNSPRKPPDPPGGPTP